MTGVQTCALPICFPVTIQGPFKFKWGANTLNNVSEISVDYTVDTSDTTTLDGNKFTVQTGMSATVTFTLLENDIASLATVLPQYHVANGKTLPIVTGKLLQTQQVRST